MLNKKNILGCLVMHLLINPDSVKEYKQKEFPTFYLFIIAWNSLTYCLCYSIPKGTLVQIAFELQTSI